MTTLADVKDRVLTAHPGAVIELDVLDPSGTSVHFRAYGTHVRLALQPDGTVDDTAAVRTLDVLNEAWRAIQRPRTSPGGPSSPGRGGDDDLVVGDVEYPGPELDDGG